jgi:hypothetical protein
LSVTGTQTRTGEPHTIFTLILIVQIMAGYKLECILLDISREANMVVSCLHLGPSNPGKAHSLRASRSNTFPDRCVHQQKTESQFVGLTSIKHQLRSILKMKQ